jgi:hypothetical protein
MTLSDLSTKTVLQVIRSIRSRLLNLITYGSLADRIDLLAKAIAISFFIYSLGHILSSADDQDSTAFDTSEIHSALCTHVVEVRIEDLSARDYDHFNSAFLTDIILDR